MTFDVQSPIFLCEKILQFHPPNTSIRQETRDLAHYVFGYGPWKEILDNRIGRYEQYSGKTCSKICEIPREKLLL